MFSLHGDVRNQLGCLLYIPYHSVTRVVLPRFNACVIIKVRPHVLFRIGDDSTMYVSMFNIILNSKRIIHVLCTIVTDVNELPWMFVYYSYCVYLTNFPFCLYIVYMLFHEQHDEQHILRNVIHGKVNINDTSV